MIGGLNKEFDHRVRLGIMSILMVNKDVDFNTVKNLLQLTDGNLASHITALEKAGFVAVDKAFVGKKPRTTYRATDTGKKAFAEHLDALEKIISLRNGGKQ
jgi:DNA-binding PadR family transcriptional regulator